MEEQKVKWSIFNKKTSLGVQILCWLQEDE